MSLYTGKHAPHDYTDRLCEEVQVHSLNQAAVLQLCREWRPLVALSKIDLCLYTGVVEVVVNVLEMVKKKDRAQVKCLDITVACNIKNSECQVH